MSVNDIFRVILNQILRRIINRGVDAGIETAFQGQKAQTRQAKKAMRLARRNVRF